MGLSAGLFPWRGKSALIGEGNRLGAVACVNLGEQVVGLPGVTGGVTRPGAAQSVLPESSTQAVCVIIAWLAAWTILGGWRMMTRDA
jgi:hypothetical protein